MSSATGLKGTFLNPGFESFFVEHYGNLSSPRNLSAWHKARTIREDGKHQRRFSFFSHCRHTVINYKRTCVWQIPFSCNICQKAFTISQITVDLADITVDLAWWLGVVNVLTFEPPSEGHSERAPITLGHKKVHTVERPYRCNLWEQKFACSSSPKKNPKVYTSYAPNDETTAESAVWHLEAVATDYRNRHKCPPTEMHNRLYFFPFPHFILNSNIWKFQCVAFTSAALHRW